MFDSIVEAISCHAKTQPDILCMADAKESLSYEQFWNCILDFSRKLCSLGITRQTCVAIECTQNIDFSISIFAVQLLGAISVPIEKKSSPDLLARIMAITNSICFIGRKKPQVETDFRFIDMAIIDKTTEYKSSITTIFPAANETAEILYSTGTTGNSKGIELTHQSLVAVAENVIHGVKMKKGGVELIPVPLSHSHGLRRHYANLFFGNSVVIADGVIFLKVFLELIEKYHVTALDLVPSAVAIILKAAEKEISQFSRQIDYIQIGTALLRETDKNLLCKIFKNTRLYNFYGSTEAGCACIVDFNLDANKPFCIGTPTINSEIEIVDKKRKAIESSSSHTGFLAIKGAMNMKGYWGNPELTNKVVQDGFLYTNDIGYKDEDGNIYLLGRDDDVINYGGVKISPEEIEEVAMLFSGITDCACVPRQDKLCGQVPVLYYSVVENSTVDAASLYMFLAQKIDVAKLPKELKQINKIPRSLNGKILRKKLTELIL